MSSFAVADTTYKAASRCSVYVVHVEPGDVEVVAEAHQRLRKITWDEDEAGKLLEILRYARFRLVSSLVPYSSEQLGLAELIVGLDAEMEFLTPGTETHHLTSQAREALRRLTSSGSNPLGEAALELLGDVPTNERMVAVRQSRTVEATGLYLTGAGAPSQVVSAQSLRSADGCESLICVGPPQFFPSATWTASRWESVCFIQYPFGWRPPAEGGAFGPDGGLKTPRFRESGTAETRGEIEPFNVSESIQMAASSASRKNRFTGGEEIESFMLLLEDGYAVWTETDESNWMLCIDADEPDSPLIVNKAASTIGPGDYLVLRSGTRDADYIRELADEEFGAAQLRKNQARWKKALAEAVSSAGSVAAAQRELRRLGATTTNVRHWTSEASIRPQRYSDFVAACRFSGIESEAESLWDDLGKIFRAHLQAGQQVRQDLESNLLSDGVHELVASGVQSYTLPRLGELAGYRVLYRNPGSEMISLGMIDRPFRAAEGGWPT